MGIDFFFVRQRCHPHGCGDESDGWQAPTTRLVGNDGKWEFVGGIHPTFDRREYWEDDSDDDDVTDLTDGAADVTAAAEADVTAATKVRTAKGDAETKQFYSTQPAPGL